jgi:hypothetical protein
VLETQFEKEFGYVQQFRTDAVSHAGGFPNGRGWLYK